MRSSGRLPFAVAAAVAGATLVAWYAYATAFPIDAPVAAAVRAVFLAAIPLEMLLSAVAIARLARPLHRALARGPGREDDVPAAAAGVALPSRASAVAALATGAAAAVAVGVMSRAGVPPDLALAAAAVAAAAAILSAMLAYSLSAAAGARALDALGAPVDVERRGSVRGKILVVGFGLNTIGVLLFASTGYVRYRTDIDREYVSAAQRAHRSARAIPGLADREIAEHVWLETARATVLVGHRGAVLARFGGGAVPIERAQGVAEGAHRLADGWLVVTSAQAGGAVATWLPEAPLGARRREIWGALATMGLLVYSATAVLAWFAARAITVPFRTLRRAAGRIAEGDLTASPPSVSRDEIGQLAGGFRRMAQGLRALVLDVHAASEGVSAGAREAAAIGERVRSGALGQHSGVVAVQQAVEAMDGSVLLVSRGVGGLSEFVATTNRAMAEMAASFEAVRRKAAELERTMQDAISDVDRLTEAGSDAEARLGQLDALAGHAGTSLAAVKSSIATLESAAGESEATAALVADMAERAGGVVEETVHGIETLRAAVADAHRRVTALGRRSDDIHQVVDFISEVAGRTNLLSLNASIIAAQAGEHGKAFGVVAEQIRELAAQIARSTKSIGDIIHSVREDVEGTAALIDRGDALAIEGVQLARNSLEALSRIQRSTGHGRETAMAIRVAVDAHAQSSGEVSRLVQSVAEETRAVAAAVQLMGRTVAGVNSVSRSVNAMADQVAHALDDQSVASQRQIENVGRLDRMIGEITHALADHDAAARRVRGALQELSRAAGEHERAVEGLSGVAGRLGGRARALAERVGRFRV